MVKTHTAMSKKHCDKKHLLYSLHHDVLSMKLGVCYTEVDFVSRLAT